MAVFIGAIKAIRLGGIYVWHEVDVVSEVAELAKGPEPVRALAPIAVAKIAIDIFPPSSSVRTLQMII